MGVTFAVGLRACCVAVGLLVAAARAAEPVSPLIGITRDQLISRYGEPKSQIEAGNRLVFLYPRERIVLRDGVVVEVEPFAGEPTAPAAPPSAPTPEGTTPGSRPSQPAQTPPTRDSKVEIKSVRTPSAKDGRAPETEQPKTAPAPAPVTPTTVPPRSSPVVELPTTKAPSVKTSPVKTSPTPTTTTSPAVPKESKVEMVPEKKSVNEIPTKKKEEIPKPAPALVQPPPIALPAPESVIGTRTYVIVLVVLVGGAFLLFWKYRQRQMELAASSVENTPLTTASTPAFSGNGFSADVLGKLEWKRFEELVAAYYSKTGVVAVRTKTGPKSAVHIKISWKGEPRPFAYVQCLAQPAGLIDPKPLQALVAALETDDIRRGYVITTGKFNVVARDFAEEKHLTLLPGDLFLEKLNALPPAARTEIMQSVSAGDYSVPSCPKCEAKMVRSTDEPPVWRCPNHPEEVMPVRT